MLLFHFLVGTIRHFFKCPMLNFRETCQTLHDVDIGVMNLRQHIIDTHADLDIFDTTTKCLRLDMLVDVFWMKRSYYDDLDQSIRQFLFSATTFDTLEPNPLAMMPGIPTMPPPSTIPPQMWWVKTTRQHFIKKWM